MSRRCASGINESRVNSGLIAMVGHLAVPAERRELPPDRPVRSQRVHTKELSFRVRLIRLRHRCFELSCFLASTRIEDERIHRDNRNRARSLHCRASGGRAFRRYGKEFTPARALIFAIAPPMLPQKATTRPRCSRASIFPRQTFYRLHQHSGRLRLYHAVRASPLRSQGGTEPKRLTRKSMKARTFAGGRRLAG